jgi:hypothetical protein
LNETLNYNSTFAEVDVEKSAATNIYEISETEPESWDAALTDYVSANAHELVVMSGAEMSLSDAMFLFPTINEENVGLIYAQVQQMVDEARLKKKEKPEETEEPNEENEPEEEEPNKTKEPNEKTKAKTEPQKPPENTKKIDKPPQPKAEIDHATKPTLNASEPAAEPRIISKIEPEPTENHSTKQEASAEKVITLPEVVSEHPAPKETPGMPSETKVTMVPEVITESKKEFAAAAAITESHAQQAVPVAMGEVTPIQSALSIEVGYEAPAPTIAVEADPAVVDYEDRTEPELQTFKEASFKESNLELEQFESVVETENLVYEEDQFDMAAEPQDVEGDDLPGDMLQLISEENILADFTDEVVVVGHPEDDIFATTELDQFADSEVPEIVEQGLEISAETLVGDAEAEPVFFEPTESASSEQQPQGIAPLEEAQTSLMRLSELIEDSPPETVIAVREILNKIIEIPAKLEIFVTNDSISETEPQEQLEELFTELLELVGMEYTPELVEVLARLTLEWQLGDEIQILKSQEDPDDTPQDIGTHEIIKKLLLSLSTLQKTLAYAGAIGKSALQSSILLTR